MQTPKFQIGQQVQFTSAAKNFQPYLNRPASYFERVFTVKYITANGLGEPLYIMEELYKGVRIRLAQTHLQS